MRGGTTAECRGVTKVEGAGPGGTQGAVLKKREWLWSEGHGQANGQGQARPGGAWLSHMGRDLEGCLGVVWAVGDMEAWLRWPIAPAASAGLERAARFFVLWGKAQVRMGSHVEWGLYRRQAGSRSPDSCWSCE